MIVKGWIIRRLRKNYYWIVMVEYAPHCTAGYGYNGDPRKTEIVQAQKYGNFYVKFFLKIREPT